MRRCSGVIALAALVALAGCSSTVVDGHPELRGPATSAGAPSHSAHATSDRAYLNDPAAVRRIEADARNDIVASNSYSYRTLAADLARGLAHTTGAFRDQYRRTFTTVVEPEARRLSAAQHVQVTLTGLQAMPTATRATVVLALQTRITRKASTPRVNPATAVATLDLVNGRWLIAALRNGGGGGALGPVGSTGLAAAGRAADRGIVDILTLSLAHFAADYARSIAATTGSLRRDVRSKRASTRAELERIHASLRGVVTGVAVIAARGSSAVFLVTADGYRSTAPDAPVRSDLRVTARLVGSRWLLSDVQNVGVS